LPLDESEWTASNPSRFTLLIQSLWGLAGNIMCTYRWPCSAPVYGTST